MLDRPETLNLPRAIPSTALDVTKTISAIVTEDFRTAAIFEKYGLDFCCRGNRTISEACQDKEIDEQRLRSDLNNLTLAASDTPNYQLWSLPFLASYIEENHHAFVRSATPLLAAHVTKIANVHGRNHPELARVRDLFLAMSKELTQHMKIEEQVLFPYIVRLARAESLHELPASPFGSVENPIEKMRSDHEEAGRAMEEIRELTNNYAPPEDGCTTYDVTLEELRAFEHDLHRHVHLENYILFPRAIELEKRLKSVV